MRILVLHSRYLSGPASGENRVVDDEVRLLRAGGHAVDLWDPSPGEVTGLGLVRTGLRTVWSAPAARRVRAMIDAVRPHVVHFHNLFPGLSPAAIRAARARGPAIVVTLHNYRLLCLSGVLFRDGRPCEDCVGRLPWPGVVHRCFRGSRFGSGALAVSLTLHHKFETFEEVDLFIAISQFVKDKHVEAGFSASRIRVKPHFAWESARRKGPGEYFLYLGRLSPEKGVPTLLDAWTRDLGELRVVGDGPQRAALERRAAPGVVFAGAASADEVPALLGGARALLAPSVCYEGAGKAVLEAYAAGVPALVSEIGGLPEVVAPDRTGLLVPPGDADAWRNAMKRLAVDGESVRLGTEALRSWRERYSPERALQQLEAAYEDALARAS